LVANAANRIAVANFEQANILISLTDIDPGVDRDRKSGMLLPVSYAQTSSVK